MSYSEQEEILEILQDGFFGMARYCDSVPEQIEQSTKAERRSWGRGVVEKVALRLPSRCHTAEFPVVVRFMETAKWFRGLVEEVAAADALGPEIDARLSQVRALVEAGQGMAGGMYQTAKTVEQQRQGEPVTMKELLGLPIAELQRREDARKRVEAERERDRAKAGEEAVQRTAAGILPQVQTGFARMGLLLAAGAAGWTPEERGWLRDLCEGRPGWAETLAVAMANPGAPQAELCALVEEIKGYPVAQSTMSERLDTMERTWAEKHPGARPLFPKRRTRGKGKGRPTKVPQLRESDGAGMEEGEGETVWGATEDELAGR